MGFLKDIFKKIFGIKDNSVKQITDGQEVESVILNNPKTSSIEKENVIRNDNESSNKKVTTKNSYELYTFDEKLKGKNYYRQYHTILNHFFSRLKYDLDLSKEEMNELVDIVTENVDAIEYVESDLRDENGEELAQILGIYEEESKTILLNATKLKEDSKFNMVTELYKQLLDVITFTKLNTVAPSFREMIRKCKTR